MNHDIVAILSIYYNSSGLKFMQCENESDSHASYHLMRPWGLDEFTRL